MTQALADVRIIEIGEMVSAPYAAKMLADMGAEVIKVERPPEGDRARRMGPFPASGPDPEQSGLFLYLNANKLGVTLDILQPEGFVMLERLLVQADILIHNVPPPEVERIGLGFERQRKINPSLIMTSVSPFGLHGPYRDYLAEELTIWNAGGSCYINGAGTPEADVPPLKTFGHPASYAGGVHAAVATMGALIARDFSGEGEHIEVALQDVMAATGFGVMFWPFMGTIMTRLGEKVVQPLEAMGKPELASDPRFATLNLRQRNEDELEDIITAWTRLQTPYEVTRSLQAAGVPAFTCNTYKDVFEDANLNQRGFFVNLNHPTFGVRTYPGVPWRMRNTPADITCPAPLLGQHTEEVLRELGYADGEIEALRQADALT